VAEDGERVVRPHRSRSWIRSLLIGLAAIFLLLVVFHGPILRHVVHSLAVHFAAKQNLKLEFRIEGGVLGGIELHNLHATPTGPSAVQSLDADLIRADYSLTDLVLHGTSDFLKDVEVRSATAVLDPAKAPAPIPTPPPKSNEKISLPAYFPNRLQLSNVNLTIRGQPQETVVRNLNIGLYPQRDGELRIDKLQIPNFHTWTNISATTTYANKNLFLRNLVLDQENHFQTLNIDASKIGSGKIAVQLDGSLGKGNLGGNIELDVGKAAYKTDTKLNASGISLAALSEYLGRPPGAMAGDVKQIQMDWHGTLDQPQTWHGTINAQIDNLRRNRLALDHVHLDVVAENGVANVKDVRLDAGNNHVQLHGSIQLPKTKEGFGRTPGNFQLSVDAPDLKQLTTFLSPPATGSLQVNGNVTIEDSTIRLNLTANGDLIGVDKAAIKKLTATIVAAKKLPPPEKKNDEPFYANLSSAIHAELSELHYDQYVVDRVEAEVKSNEATVSLEPVTVTRNANLLVVRGNYQLPPPDGKALEQPADLQFSFRVPQLVDYWQSDAANKVTGQLQAGGGVRVRKGVATGQVNLYGQEIAAQKVVVRQLSTQISIANNIAYLNDLTATLNEKDYVSGNGTLELRKPFQYTGGVTANLADLSTFKSLLSSAGTETALAGSLVLNWHGQGEIATFKNNGDLKVSLENGRSADMRNLHAKIDANYTPQELNIPVVFLGSDKMDFQASLQAKGSTLEVSKIQIDQGTAKYATGYVSLPFNWSNVGTDRPTFPPNGNVMISVQSQNLDIKKVFEDLGVKPPASGLLDVNVDAQGPLDQLVAGLDLQLRDVRVAQVEKLEPASFNLGLRLANNELKVEGKLQQARVQPVQIDAHLPLNVAQIIATKKLDEQTPLSAKVQMPRSSVNFVRQFVPALRDLDGSLALDVNVGGTIAKPALSGAADMNINVARFNNATLPALTNFKALLNFHDNILSFDRCAGDLAGGPFSVAGKITLPKLTEPNLDLRLNANSVLVARNDNLTARIDADIKVEGPLQSATVTGNIATTNSQFLKDIDIIPIGLPGRPAPQPPASRPTLSFPNPPLRDWKFDVAIKSKDPFLVHGNLANGTAIIDMKLTGTGLHPGLQGQVRLENFEATLPFSTLSIQYGFLYFDPDDPLNPRIELHGTSLLRDYTIHVFVYGTTLSPEAVFNSEPPLPQEEIISLLATGVTREELTGSGNVLAGRAGLLLVKQLYRKIFKKGAPTQNDSIFNRLDVEFGNVDPRTGQQSATAKFKVNENIVLVGDLEVGGDYRGLVKYLIRFR